MEPVKIYKILICVSNIDIHMNRVYNNIDKIPIYTSPVCSFAFHTVAAYLDPMRQTQRSQLCLLLIHI